MEEIFRSFLFHKNLIAGGGSSDTAAILFTLLKKFGIKITSGSEYLDLDSIKICERELGFDIPKPFYKGFPETVKGLTTEEKLLDQIIHYLNTYGFNNFTDPGHSLIEADFKRLAFNEHARERELKAISYKEAEDIIIGYTNTTLATARGLNDSSYELIKKAILKYDLKPKEILSKDITIRLFLDTRDFYFASFLSLSDVIKVAMYLSYYSYGNDNIKKLSLKNQDRKLIASLIDYLFKIGSTDIEMCFSKKRLWNGLLHHIHYIPINSEANSFINMIRDKGNISPYSKMISLIEEKKINEAVDFIKAKLGNGAYIRNLSYLLSRANNEGEITYIIDNIKTNNNILLLELINAYSNNDPKEYRYFTFNRFNKLVIHTETIEEHNKRGTILSDSTISLALNRLYSILKNNLKGRINKLYIDNNMDGFTIPYDEVNGANGIGVMPKGSRIKIPDNKIIRAFTYWERVPDIDLSLIMINNDDTTKEFSWRTNAFNEGEAILFSGDQTSGINGGSEYYDIDLKRIKEEYSEARYLVVADNVFSGMLFKDCEVYAGYMERDRLDSGEVYEPRCVKSKFKINASSRFAYMYAIDLATDEIIWLNIAKNSLCNIAYLEDIHFIKKYFNRLETLGLEKIFKMMATELVDDYNAADIILSDSIDKDNVIHSYDVEKIMSLLA